MSDLEKKQLLHNGNLNTKLKVSVLNEEETVYWYEKSILWLLKHQIIIQGYSIHEVRENEGS